jgi:hypothetical protein
MFAPVEAYWSRGWSTGEQDEILARLWNLVCTFEGVDAVSSVVVTVEAGNLQVEHDRGGRFGVRGPCHPISCRPRMQVSS